MADVVVYGFPVSTYVNIVRLLLSHKQVPYRFVDLEPEMGGPRHLALHPFGRVPILEHDGFRLYETAAIAAYIDEAFEGPKLTPEGAEDRARMNRWISALNGYYYPYIAFHLGHERLIYPPLGVAPDEKVVQVALPRIATGLEVLEEELSDGREFLVGRLSLADFVMTPTMTTLSLTPEGSEMLKEWPLVSAWRARMMALPAAQTVMAEVAPHIGKPVEHARGWVATHRPRY